MNDQLLFVYGPMAEGMVHLDQFKNFMISVIPAVARGSVYRLKVGYPGMVLSGQDFIRGNLVSFKSSEVLWHLLDGFYGFNPQEPSRSLYQRQRVNVLAQEALVAAWVYVLSENKVPQNIQPIPEGNWEASLQQEPPLSDRLTEKQKKYVLKLGASSGREIIPIDMTLYRELMSLELIVDKGRRLALSRLGQELYQHLK